MLSIKWPSSLIGPRATYDAPFGRFIPICGGRCLRPIPKDDNVLSWSIMLIIVPPSLALGFVVPDIFNQPHNDQLGLAAVVLGATTFALILLSLYLLMRVKLTEPGILMVDESPETEGGGSYLGSFDRGPPKVKLRVVVQGQMLELHQKRAKMCRQLDSCIENFDHYCPWVGNAIGRRNYRLFVFFLAR